MKTTSKHDQRMAEMTFASVYPHYVTKIKRKGRSKEGLHQVITKFTGFEEEEMEALIADVTFEEFFNPHCVLSRLKEIF